MSSSLSIRHHKLNITTMAQHNDFGKKGELEAARYLTAKGYRIVETNWRCQHLEVDLIAEYEDKIVVIEVKSRSSDQWGSPDESVSNAKIKFLATAIEIYLDKNDIDKEVQFDVISIISHQQKTEIIHIEDAFHPIANQ